MTLFAPLPNKKYDIIYADPPWAYTTPTGKHNNGLQQSALRNYAVISLDKLCELGISKIASVNCMLFLWATGPTLHEAMILMQAWGFKYKQVAYVWHKQNKVFGNYTLTSCEFVLVGTNNTIPKPNKGVGGNEQFLSQMVGKHSQKPFEIRDRISKRFNVQSKIELFARPAKDGLIPDDTFKGWDTWGNEA